MRATLLPLKGKYYGTKILVEFDNGISEEIVLWNNGSFTPSDRELEYCEITRYQYDNNLIVDHDNFYGDVPAREACEVYDSHFESQETYENALELIRVINGGGYD